MIWKIFLPFLFISFCFAQNNTDKWNVNENKSFIENKGQFDGRNWRSDAPILYSVNYNPFNIYFSKNGWTYRFDKLIKNPLRKENPLATPKRLSISELINVTWVNSNPNVEIIAESPVDFYYSYAVLKGDETINLNQLKGYEKLIYKNLYPNIDVEYIIHTEGGIKYNVILHPGANPKDLKLHYKPASTSALKEQINIALNNQGQLEITTSLGSVIEHAPITFYQNGALISSKYEFKDNILSFELAAYDNTKTVVIDPWIISPNFITSTAVWEVETDAAGNVYAIGGETPMELKKYDINGNLLWNYVTPFDTNNVWLGTLATDAIGNSYVTSGTSPTMHKVSPAGALLWTTQAGGNLQFSSEWWSITFNCNQTKLIVGGTWVDGLFSFDYFAGIFEIDVATGAVLADQQVDQTNISGFGATPVEVRSISSSRNAKYVFLTHKDVGTITDNLSFCGNNAPIFQVPNQKQLGYKCENYLPQTQNGGGLKGIVAGDNFFYTHGGSDIRQWDLATGALINTATIPGGSSTTVPLIGGNVINCSGLAIDDCGNVYAGSMNQVVQFDANLNVLSSIPTTFNVYDVAVNSNGEVIACGAQQNNAATNRNGRIESMNFNACNQFSLICCDANFCNPGPLCVTDGPVTIQVSTPGGTWSGTGVNASGVFDPAIAGIGAHIITYTLACGQEQQTVLVSPCQPLEACLNADGTVTITNGAGTIVWEETIAPSSSPITNQTECEACGYTWLPAIPFISPASCVDATLSTVTTCNSPGGLQQFATGVTVMPTTNFPIVVTDAAGNQIILNDLNNLPDCVTLPCTNLNVAITNQTNISCAGGSNGAATLSASGGNGSYTFSWQPGNLSGASQTGLAAGTYTVDVIDSDGCAGSVQVIITAPAPLILTTNITNAECGVANGAIDLTVSGGTSPYTYVWSNGTTTQDLTSILPGPYQVTVTDANGCQQTGNYAVSSTDGPDITLVTSQDASCFGLANGSATVSASGGAGGFTFTWQPGNLAGPTQNALAGGTYTVTVIDADGCPASLTVTINQPSEIQLDLGATPSSCTVDDGTVSVSASGGDGNFTYLWSNGSTTSTVPNVGPGIYTVTVTDGNNCQIQGSVTVNTINGPTVSISSIIDETCVGSSDGSATASASGGTPGYTYSWSPTGGNAATASGLTAGTYTVTVLDAAGCSAIQTVTIGSGALLVEVVPDAPVINNGEEVTLNVIIDPNIPGATYSWTPADGLSCSDCPNPIASPSQTTTYQVTVTTPEGCIGTALVTVFVNAPCQEAMVPSTFSPNGDGLNDLFCVLEIVFNRWN
jgi:hypothetical protein